MSERIKSPLEADAEESLAWLRKRISKLESELASLKEREAILEKRASDKNQPALFLLDE